MQLHCELKGVIMRIEHVAIYVRDLEGAKEFFVKYFGAIPNNMYRNPTTGFSSYFLSFDDGSRIEIMNKPELIGEKNNGIGLGYSHIAFSVGSREKVDEITNSLKDAGYNVASGPRTTGDGYYESCVAAFENNLIEITV